MNIPIFELERIQSLYENTVDLNLTESGFHPYKLNELLNKDQLEELQNLVLGYGQTNGSIPLRTRISETYSSTGIENVLVTNGSAEANYVACHSLLNEGDEVLIMLPNYMQMWGVLQEIGCVIKEFKLKAENAWEPDMEQVKSLISAKTKMIILCNPNNPTGYTLSKEEMNAFVDVAKSVNAWLYCDEIYRGAELDGKTRDSFIGMYDKVMVCGGLSKAYALPGLRLGWLVGPEEAIEKTWAYHDYTSITAGIMSHYIGEIALQPEKRQEIFTRNRTMLNENLMEVCKWMDQFGGLFEYTPPQSGGMLFVKYNLDINSTELSDWLRTEKSVFIVPGDCYGLDGHFRIGIGARKQDLKEGLERIKIALKEKFNI